MTSRPNFVWVSFEDTNPFYRCYGDPFMPELHVDRLAAEGRRWTRCFSTAGVCAPARSAIITGCYPTWMGTHNMRTTHKQHDMPELPTPYNAVVPPTVRCFTEHLRSQGYYCSNNSKTDYQFRPPLMAWDDCSTDGHWRHRQDPDQPFFAVFNPTVSHESGMWDPETRAEKAPNRDPSEPDWEAMGIDEVPVPPYFPDTRKVRESLVRMYNNIRKADETLGQVLAQLEEDGLADNTYVFHWSDHGPMPRGKRWPYDSGIRVPLIVRGPGIEAGSVSEDLVSTLDLGPTLFELAGLDAPACFQGQAFLGEEKPPARTYVFASRDRHDCSWDQVRAVRDARYKLITHGDTLAPRQPWIPYLNRHPIQQELWRARRDGELTEATAIHFASREAEELYDTKSDPWEQHNLAKDPAQAKTLERLRSALNDWRATYDPWRNTSEETMVRQWFPDGEPLTTAPPIAAVQDEAQDAIDLSTGGEITVSGRGYLMLESASPGASIGWRLRREDPWTVYTDAIPLETIGDAEIEVVAERIGYEVSPIRRFRLVSAAAG